MKKNRFQQQKEQIQEKTNFNYFDDNIEVNLEPEKVYAPEVLQAKFQRFEDDHQIPLTHPDYESLIHVHFTCYEKNQGLFDFVNADKQLFNKICISFVYIDQQIAMIEETFYAKILDKMTIYGELGDLHLQEDHALKDGEAEIMIARMFAQFKTIYDIIKKIINYVTHLINQLNLIYNKKDPIYKATFKQFNIQYPLDTIGRALSMIYILDQVVEQNEYLMEHWNYYKRMVKMIRPDAAKFDTNEVNFKNLEKILIRLDKTVLSGQCLQGVLAQQWDASVIASSGQAKNSNVTPIKNNKELQNLILSYLKDKVDMLEKILGSPKEVFERNQLLPSLCVYALYRKLYPSDEQRELWKQYWSLQKKAPFLEGHSQVLVWVSKFLMEVIPLQKKSKTMDPKDPIVCAQLFLQNMSKNFNVLMSNLYAQFTAWLVRIDSYATSSSSFDGILTLSKDKADQLLEDRLSQRVTLIVSGLSIALQIRNQVQGLILGLFGMEDMKLDKGNITDISLGVQMLKAIEYYLSERLEAFQPAFLNREIMKNMPKIINLALSKAKQQLKIPGNDDVVAAIQIIGNISRSAISPLKLMVLQYCSEYLLNSKDSLLSSLEKDEYKIILWKLDKVVLLPQYIRKVTSSTYFYWCRDLLPSFFQSIYAVPASAKRFQFLLNAISDCSKQLSGCIHLSTPDELKESFRKYVLQEFHQSYLKPLARDIEDFLRIQVHYILIEKIECVNPLQKQVKDIRRLLDVDQVLIFDSIINLRVEINQNLNEAFYNMNVLNMYDMETYEQMRSLANFKFGLQLMNVYLPSQTIDQGSFDVLNIIKNIQGFIKKYTYNMYTQTFQQITSDSKQVYTVGISQISDSIRTHGLGILNTNINSVYQYIKKKLNAFSTFLFDDYINAPLTREERFFNENKAQLDSMYPYERAEALYKEIKKLGQFDDGKNFLDKFRILITEIGNALGFIRLLRSAQLNFCAKSIEFLPYGYERDSSFNEQAKTAGFGEATQGASQELDEVFELLKKNFSGSTDYLQMMVKVFQGIKTPENKHLNLFYLIIPSLTINFIENMLVARERLNKKNAPDCFITDDGFIMGVQYFLFLLKEKNEFEGLNWKKEVRGRFKKEFDTAKNIQQKSNAQTQRQADEINMQKELSLRKLTYQKEEFGMLFYAYNTSKILFMDKGNN